MSRDNKLSPAYQQMVLIRYAEWASFKKWKILSDKVNGLVVAKKFANIYQGGASVDNIYDWNTIENAIEKMRIENGK